MISPSLIKLVGKNKDGSALCVGGGGGGKEGGQMSAKKVERPRILKKVH